MDHVNFGAIGSHARGHKLHMRFLRHPSAEILCRSHMLILNKPPELCNFGECGALLCPPRGGYPVPWRTRRLQTEAYWNCSVRSPNSVSDWIDRVRARTGLRSACPNAGSLRYAGQGEVPEARPRLGCDAALKRLDTLFADRLNHAAKLLDASAEPRQLLGRDAVMPGVARLHVGVL